MLGVVGVIVDVGVIVYFVGIIDVEVGFFIKVDEFVYWYFYYSLYVLYVLFGIMWNMEVGWYG